MPAQVSVRDQATGPSLGSHYYHFLMALEDRKVPAWRWDYGSSGGLGREPSKQEGERREKEGRQRMTRRPLLPLPTALADHQRSPRGVGCVAVAAA